MTPGGSRNISFSPRIQFHDTWPSGEYDRRGEIATCNRLTPVLAQQIKEELNTFKMVRPTDFNNFASKISDCAYRRWKSTSRLKFIRISFDDCIVWRSRCLIFSNDSAHLSFQLHTIRRRRLFCSQHRSTLEDFAPDLDFEARYMIEITSLSVLCALRADTWRLA